MDPQVVAMRERRAAAGAAPLYTLSVEQARAEDLADIQAAGGSPEPVGAVSQREIDGPAGPIPIRIYEPADTGADAGIGIGTGAGTDTGTARPRPVLTYFYGGGWTLGSLDTCDAICRSLTNQIGCVTVSVGYRLAPEHPFPAAVEDCYAGFARIAAEGRAVADRSAVGTAPDTALDLVPGVVAIAGDSAGGNLAAAVTLMARARGGPRPVHQLLVYPNTDYRAQTDSLRENDDPMLFNRRSVAWYWGNYLASASDGDNPLVSPLRAPSLAGLPPATVITAEFDPLRDEGEQYAQRLEKEGVPVELRRYDGMAHGFFAMGGVLDAGRDAVAYAAARLRGAFAQAGR
jgi:acetyl esterase